MKDRRLTYIDLHVYGPYCLLGALPPFAAWRYYRQMKEQKNIIMVSFVIVGGTLRGGEVVLLFRRVVASMFWWLLPYNGCLGVPHVRIIDTLGSIEWYF